MTPTPTELGQTIDPASAPFIAPLENLPDGIDRDLATRLRRGLWESDPVADDVVIAFSQVPGGAGWRMLDRALADGLDTVPDAPRALHAMLAPILTPPDWVNWELVDAGAVAYGCAGLANVFAGARALGYGYPIARIAKVLLGTGRIEEMAGKRLVETGHFVLAATAPDGMRPGGGGDGIATCIRVRLVHAYVRRHMLAQDDWDLQRDAIPLNTTDTAATLNIGLFALHVQGLEQIGIRHTPAELEALAHMWRWIGYVMGLPDDLQLHSFQHAVQMHEVYDAFGQRTDTDSARTLTTALIRHGLPQVAFGIPASRANDLARLTVPFTSALLAYMLGPDAARTAGLGRNPLTLPMHAAPLAGRAYNLLRAGGLLGNDARLAQISFAAMARLLANTGSASAPVHPETAVSEARTSQRAAA
jgi:hypothetical protein